MRGKEYLVVKQEFMKGRLTPIYTVWSKNDITLLLGKVVYRPTWRNMVWQQEPEVDMSESCLLELFRKVNSFEMERKYEGVRRI